MKTLIALALMVIFGLAVAGEYIDKNGKIVKQPKIPDYIHANPQTYAGTDIPVPAPNPSTDYKYQRPTDIDYGNGGTSNHFIQNGH